MNHLQQRAFRDFLGSTIYSIKQSYLKKNSVTCVKLPSQFYSYVNSHEFLEILSIQRQRCIRGKWDAYTSNTTDIQLVQYSGIYYIEYKHRYLSKKQAKQKHRLVIQTFQAGNNTEREKVSIGYTTQSYPTQQINTDLFALSFVSFM